MRRLPQSHTFPGGFRVDIEVVAFEIPAGDLRPDSLGEYETMEADRGRIRLWDGLTPAQRWHTLMHELLHALADAQLYVEGTK